MIEVYDVVYSVSIDGAPYRRVCGVLDDVWKVFYVKPENGTLLENVPFDHAYRFVSTLPISGVHATRTWIRNRPQINIMYAGAFQDIAITKCKTFSLRVDYKLRNVTMKWLLDNLSVEDATPYIIQHGLQSYL